MQQEYQKAPQQMQQKSDLRKLGDAALAKLQDAALAVEAYRKMRDAGGAVFIPDEFDKHVEEIVRGPLFLGAPGEQCEVCGGSGRKK